VIEALPARIRSKISAPADGCWTWTGAGGDGDYGAVWYQGSTRKAHVVVYELLVGPVPAGLELDHLCRVKHCVRPDHLEPVTHAENMRRTVRAATARYRQRLRESGTCGG
jgi:hypothetical protein